MAHTVEGSEINICHRVPPPKPPKPHCGQFVIFHKATRCYKKPRENWGLRTLFQIYQHQFGKPPFRIRKCMALFAAAQQSREVTCGHGFPRLPCCVPKVSYSFDAQASSACQSSCTWAWASACVQMLAVQNPSLAKKAGLWRTTERNSHHLYPLPQRSSTNLGDICRPEKTKPQCQLPFFKDPWPT